MKVLFICNRLPVQDTAGGELIDGILKSHGLDKFDIVAVSSKVDEGSLGKEYKKIKKLQYPIRFAPSSLLMKVLKKLPLLEPIIALYRRPRVLRKIFRLLSENHYDLVFTLLRGEVLLIINQVIDYSGLPLIAMVEDTVEREITDHRSLYKLKYESYYKALKKVLHLGVAGETMSTFFKEKHNLKSVILRPSYPVLRINSKNIKDVNFFFSGNLYARKEFDTFLFALDDFAFNNPSLQIRFFVATHSPISNRYRNFNLVNLGWRDRAELVRIMENCHIAYLPYKFDTEFKHSMSYAFPGKAGFYISNGLPIFFHGPDYSSFNTFIEKYKVGLICNSLLKERILIELKRFTEDSTFYNLCRNECERAFKHEFSKSVFHGRVNKFFEI